MLRRKWSRQKIIDEILELHRKGEDLSDRNIRANYSRLLHAGKRYFRNWGAVLEAGGFDSEKIKHHKSWSEKKILQKIRESFGQGEDLTDATMRKKHPRLYSAACGERYFGGWKNAVEAAGIDYAEHLTRKPQGYWTKERVIETI